MKYLLITILLASAATPAAAKCDIYGNCYTVRESNDGTVRLRGDNANGSWSETYKPDGSYNGYDIDGNYYTGDNKTGRYYNYGTGKTCYGKGAGRACY